MIVAMALLLVACAQKLDGTYSDKMGIMGLTFKGNKVIVKSAFGGATEWKYEIEGDQLRILTTQGTLISVINKDGSIEMMGTKLIKR
jgi:hypothetical protein